MDKKAELSKIFAIGIRDIIRRVNVDFESLLEIRLRVNSPLLVLVSNREYFVKDNGELVHHSKDAHIVTYNEIRETMEYIGNYSLYAYEDELRQGFVTIQGGHRIGVAGKIVVDDERIKNIKYISFINIRLSHQVKGCADKVLPYVRDGDSICDTLIISPPRCGKTTILRDMIRQISEGFGDFEGCSVGVVDERSEIGACYLGVPQNDLGMRTDILDCCPKAKGMMMLIRSMSPYVVAVDEIGSREDVEAIAYVMNSGCKIIATVHGNSVDDIKTKPVLRKLVEERQFQRYIVLNNEGEVGHVAAIFDDFGCNIYDARVKRSK